MMRMRRMLSRYCSDNEKRKTKMMMTVTRMLRTAMRRRIMGMLMTATRR